MALFHIDALLAHDLLLQIIKVDEVILYLKVGNAICQECITAGQKQTDPGPSSCTPPTGLGVIDVISLWTP